jgi:hypothetical protein
MIQEQDGDLETKKKNAQIKTDKILDYIKAVCDKA